MANICEYHVLVKGRKNACYALYGSMPLIMGSEKNIEYQGGTEKDYQIVFTGQCKWSVDYRTDMYDKLEIQTVPDEQNEAIAFGEDYFDVSLQGKSRIFQIEVWCNSVDLDEFYGICSYHFNNGKDESIPYEDMPEQIAMSEYEEADEEYGNFDETEGNEDTSIFDDSCEETRAAIWDMDLSLVKRIATSNQLMFSLRQDEYDIKTCLVLEIIEIAKKENRLPMDVFLEMKYMVEKEHV